MAADSIAVTATTSGAPEAQQPGRAPAAPSGIASTAVQEEDLECTLAGVRRAAAGPIEGVFGPNSLTWQIHREAAVFLGAGRALLLQLAHPWVASGIAEQSSSLDDPIGRFHRTFNAVFAMVFGTADQATAIARRLHRRHAAIHGIMPRAVGPFPAGSPYRANDLGALTWVQATLTQTCVLAYELILPALTATERERYYAESRHFAGLFGIPTSSLPADWRGFLAYNNQMHRSDVLTVGGEARMIVEKLLFDVPTWRRMPAWYIALTAGLLPGPVREGFGLRYSPTERRSAERALARFRQIYPLLPERVRFVGPYQEARARLAGAARPHVCVRLLNSIWIGRPLQGS